MSQLYDLSVKLSRPYAADPSNAARLSMRWTGIRSMKSVKRPFRLKVSRKRTFSCAKDVEGIPLPGRRRRWPSPLTPCLRPH